MHGSGRKSEPEKRLRASLWLVRPFNKSEMALFSECTERYAQNMLDTADIVREAIFQQLWRPASEFRLHSPGAKVSNEGLLT